MFVNINSLPKSVHHSNCTKRSGTSPTVQAVEKGVTFFFFLFKGPIHMYFGEDPKLCNIKQKFHLINRPHIGILVFVFFLFITFGQPQPCWLFFGISIFRLLNMHALNVTLESLNTSHFKSLYCHAHQRTMKFLLAYYSSRLHIISMLAREISNRFCMFLCIGFFQNTVCVDRIFFLTMEG